MDKPATITDVLVSISSTISLMLDWHKTTVESLKQLNERVTRLEEIYGKGNTG